MHPSPQPSETPSGPASGPAPGARLRIGTVELSSPLVLAPLAGWTDTDFRAELRALGGVGLAVTEVVSAKGLVAGHARTWALVAHRADDEPLAVQIQARTPADAAEAARRLVDVGVFAVDLNLGCPVRKVHRKGGGAAIGVEPARAAEIAGAAVGAVSIPVTAKLRLGWDADDRQAPEVARALEEAGVAAVTVHGRTRAQVFSGRVCREGIRRVVEAVSIPVIANGDVGTVADARAMLRETGARGLMLGRGAVVDPWLFPAVHAALEGRQPPAPPTLAERLAFLARHHRGVAERVGERHGTRLFRKVLRACGLALGADPTFAAEAVRVESTDDVARVLASLAAAADRLRPPPVPAACVPTPKRPVDRW